MANTIAAVLIANLPVQVEWQRRPATPEPFLITDPADGTRVLAASPAAAQAGVTPGMAVMAAERLAPTRLVLPPDEADYHARHCASQAALAAFSPAIETQALGEWFVDARGLTPHFPCPEALAEAMCGAVSEAAGLQVSVGIASGKFIAQLAARMSAPEGTLIVAPGNEARFVAPLPLSVLPGLPGEFARRLALFDLRTLGDLAALPKPAVLRQFGPEMAGLYELACGRDPRPLNPDVPPLRLVRSLRFPYDVQERPVLVRAAARLAHKLAADLATRGYHAEAVKIELRDELGGKNDGGLACKPPTYDAAALVRLATQIVERLEVRRPVSLIALVCYPLRPWHLGAHQLVLMRAGVSARQIRLEAALQVLRHRFGEAVLRVAALVGAPRPIPIEVELGAEGAPARVRLNGAWRAVGAVDGTWRIETGWWEAACLLRRDYVRVELVDGTLRNVFQDLVSGEWFWDRSWPLL